MPKIKFSERQLKAIRTGGNVIVSAGAGSGKTAVMIERIVGKLGGGARLENMLIVTFTRSAAADIRAKLAQRLTELKNSDEPAHVRAKAAEASDAMPTANIGTLHSFCQRLIRNYFYAAEFDIAATLVEEEEAAAMKRAAVRAALDAAVAAGDGVFIDIYEALSSRRDDSGAAEAVLDIMEFALSVPEPDKYLAAAAPDADRIKELDAITDGRRAALVARLDKVEKELERIESEYNADGQADTRIAEITELVREARAVATGGVSEFTPFTLRRKKGDTGAVFALRDAAYERFKDIKSDIKDFLVELAEAEQAKKRDSAPYANALKAVAADAVKRYSERKKRLCRIDYSDLEHGARRVLADRECGAEIKETVKYVFIDEFQDVNPLQASIAAMFEALGAEMFLIGDVKQSIYGFRRCSPKFFADAIADAKAYRTNYTHIPLNDNYRSSRAVVDFVNKVFDGVMTAEFGGAEYVSEPLVCGNTDIAAGSAEYFTAGTETDDRDTDGFSPDRSEVYSVVRAADEDVSDPEAEFIVNAVTDYVKEDGNTFGGVAVLVRTLGGKFCASLAHAFENSGIKYNFGKSSPVSEYPEAVTLLAILRCIDNRYDDVSLYTALRHGMGGFTDAELYRIAEEGEKRAKEKHIMPERYGAKRSYAFWQKVEAYDGALRTKLDAFFELREEFSRFAKCHDAADAIGHVTANTDYFRTVYESGGSAGAVQALIDYAAGRKCDLHTFLAYTDGSDFKLDAGAGADSVTVTTIHSSKGLEYDFVIVADCAHRFNMADNYSRVMVTDGGVAVKIPDRSTRTLLKSVPWLVENTAGPDKLRQEELRLFYVALTRARRKLIVCGKSAAGTEPTRAMCELDFMKNVMPRPARIADRDKAVPAVYALPNTAAVTAAVKARLGAEYASVALPIKTSVTAISEYDADGGEENTVVLTDDETLPRKTASGKRNSAADPRSRGTAYHRAMELIDFDAPDIEYVRARCENFELVDEKQILTAAAAMKKIVAGCEFVAKERYFIADMPTREVFGGGADGDSVLVQGVIDLLAVDAKGEAVIVDYKTTAPDKLDCEAYRTQLRLYKAAVERCTPYKVKRAMLYSFVTGDTVEFV